MWYHFIYVIINRSASNIDTNLQYAHILQHLKEFSEWNHSPYSKWTEVMRITGCHSIDIKNLLAFNVYIRLKLQHSCSNEYRMFWVASVWTKAYEMKICKVKVIDTNHSDPFDLSKRTFDPISSTNVIQSSNFDKLTGECGNGGKVEAILARGNSNPNECKY